MRAALSLLFTSLSGSAGTQPQIVEQGQQEIGARQGVGKRPARASIFPDFGSYLLKLAGAFLISQLAHTQ